MKKNPTIQLVAAAALVDAQGRALLQRRPAGKAMAGLWEFPGGKVETDERVEDALTRELEEELGINVAANALQPVAAVSAELGAKTLLLQLFICRNWGGIATPLESPEAAWFLPNEIGRLAMPPADYPLAILLNHSLGQF